MDVKYLILLLFILAGCLPQAEVSRGRQTSTSTTGGSSGGETVSETSWNYLSTITQDITINVSNLNNAYIIGSKVEAFLNIKDSFGAYSNFTDANYCLVSRYKLSGISYESRSRIVPLSYYDFNLKRTVRIFRVDFNDVSASSTYCSGVLSTYDSNGNVIPDPTVLTPIFDPAQICTNCSSLLTASENLRIFRKTPSSGLLEIQKTVFQVAALKLSVDPNNNGGANGSCTQGSCVSAGYDCCLENQCVRDAGTRPSGKASYPDLYAVAEQERLSNPMAYLNYPQLYYICGSTPVTTTGGSAGGSSTGGSNQDAAWTQLLKDYQCYVKVKSISTSTPWTTDLISSPSNFTNIAECTTANPSTGANAYQDVSKRLFQACGCAKTTLSEMVSSCPAYEYSVTAGTTANPTSIACYTPPSTPTGPINQQSVSVNSRSAPHRFFDVNGNETTLSSTSNQQEGEKFEYLDSENIVPSQKDFSMNAITGQMSVALNQALPAKSVTVEIDQVYFLSTTSGYYSPCPTCGKDSWTDALSAYPVSQKGSGLEAVGHTTERDGLSTNSTGGNYEDTIFGRACWLPPTMLPFSHSAKTSTQIQRQNRLQTQAALYVNGYQRDWYGFNKGALIGSFDGVTWFAIGNGRIVRSTSKKLFLAINAPFADLAISSTHVVNVQAYDGITQASQIDYDPSYHTSHPYQNSAGTCQANHKCNVDSDCVSKLGWEYMCADVGAMKTQWPSFDVDGKELVATSTTVGIDQILQQKTFGSSGRKRCVYRGSGSLCLVNANAVADSNKKKTLTCAPNFYCANVSSSGVFNSKLARWGAPIENIPVARNHLFGKDANVLGRPLSYISSSDTTALPSDVRATLIENLSKYDSLAVSNTGVCLPGKALPEVSNQATLWNPFTQHASADASRRTDYISQIGSCNSSLFSSYRYSSCPVIGADGNYEMFDSTTLMNGGYHLRARTQNSCGLDTLYNNTSLSQSADSLLNASPFKLVEGKTLNSQIILSKTLARDACLRRAGQVCQTDLDCGPNKLHAEQVDYFSLDYFGNDAERKYYSEYLLCGQADPKPFPSQTDAFKNYDMTKNRCCREVGKDLSTYTSDIATSINSSGTVLYDSSTVGLKMSTAPGIAPNDPKRYSRLASVKDLGLATRPILSGFQNRSGTGLTLSSTGANLLTPNQWATLGEANSNNCCGGGWVRKFSDGSNDWSRRDRLYLDVSNFRCINSRSVLMTTPTDALADYNLGDLPALVNTDYSEYCNDSSRTNDGCVEWNFANSLSDTAPGGVALTDTITVNTVNPANGSGNLDFYYRPKSADSDTSTVIDHTNATGRKNITIRIPSFVSRKEFDQKITGGTMVIQLVRDDNALIANCAPLGFTVTGPGDIGGTPGGCYYAYNSLTRVLNVVGNGYPSARYGIRFTVNRPGTGFVNRTQPGSSSYYLRRLGRLELSGIPQVPHAELYCNDNSDNVVKGIFKTDRKTRTQFRDTTRFSFTNGGSEYFTSSLGLAVEPVFSANDFKCCTPLGKTTQNPTNCCSGSGVRQGTSSNYTCSLPAGSNLNIYFNRFVSNEGRGTDQPGGGLVDADFEAQTGEPTVSSTTVQSKINALGVAYCASGKVRQGGAFGPFQGEPAGSDSDQTKTLFTIVDSPNDYGQNSNAGQTVPAGYDTFMNGFRWNHHLYCDD